MEKNSNSMIFQTDDLDEIITFLKRYEIIKSNGPYCIKCAKQYEWKKRSGSNR